MTEAGELLVTLSICTFTLCVEMALLRAGNIIYTTLGDSFAILLMVRALEVSPSP